MWGNRIKVYIIWERMTNILPREGEIRIIGTLYKVNVVCSG